jgi:hypothetical protein
MRVLLLALIFIAPCIVEVQAQDVDTTRVDLMSVDYSKYDDIALSFSEDKYETTADLAEALTDGVDEDYGRYRILYRWVAKNITFSPKGDQKPEKVLKSRTADTYGFTNFMAELCDEGGIWAEPIEGYGRINSSTDLTIIPSKPNHSWLKVELDDSLYLSDPIWSSVKYDPQKEMYIPYFTDTYFISDPVDFGLSHSPIDKENSFVEKMPSLSKFIKPPIYHHGYIDLKISTSEPELLKGIINEDLKIRFKAGTKIESVHFLFNQPGAEPLNVTFDTIEDEYEFNFVFDPDEVGEFTIIMNDKDVMSFIKKP